MPDLYSAEANCSCYIFSFRSLFCCSNQIQNQQCYDLSARVPVCRCIYNYLGALIIIDPTLAVKIYIQITYEHVSLTRQPNYRTDGEEAFELQGNNKSLVWNFIEGETQITQKNAWKRA